jgi:hypothetical protein
MGLAICQYEMQKVFTGSVATRIGKFNKITLTSLFENAIEQLPNQYKNEKAAWPTK